MEVTPIAQGLPTNFAASVGRIIARWAYVEWLLSQAIYDMLGIGPKQGRISVRTPRAEDCITMIEELLQSHRLALSENFGPAKTILRNAENKRNTLAHSIWLKVPKTKEIRIQVTKGNWNLGPNGKVSKKVIPEGIPVNAALLASYRNEVEIAVKTALHVRQVVILAMTALQDIQRERAQTDHQPRGQKTSIH